jgi:hypothetical protein
MNVKRGQYFPNELKAKMRNGEGEGGGRFSEVGSGRGGKECRCSKLTPVEFGTR